MLLDSCANHGNKDTGIVPGAILDAEIHVHEEHDKQQGYLSQAISYCWGSSKQSLLELKELDAAVAKAQKSGDQAAVKQLSARVDAAIKADQQGMYKQDEINAYARDFLKTAGLFLHGKIGLAGTIGIYALDQMCPEDSLKTQLVDGVLGGAKGALLRGSFELLGNRQFSVAAQGLGLGITSRVLDLGLTRSTYFDKANSRYSLSTGLTRTALGSIDEKDLISDVLVFGLAHGLIKTVNATAENAVSKSPLVSTMLTGTAFGLSTGSVSEIARQREAHEKFDLSKVIGRSLMQGALDTMAALPGGLQARAADRVPISMSNSEALSRTQPLVDKAPSSSVDFIVMHGLSELRAFRDGHKPNGALLDVRQVLSESPGKQLLLGPNKKLLMQHDLQKLGNSARQADIIGSCSTGLVDGVAGQVLLDGPLWLTQGGRARRVRLSSQRESIEAIPLGDQPKVASSGDQVQNHLFQFMSQPWEVVSKHQLHPNVVELVDLHQQVQKQLQGDWKLVQSQKKSPADHAGMDYILFNTKDGRYFFFDATLDVKSKEDLPALRRSAIVPIRLSESGLPSLDTKKDFARQILHLMDQPSILNTRDTKPPSWGAIKTLAETQAEIVAFRGRLSQKANALDANHGDIFSARALREYQKDLLRVQTFAGQENQKLESTTYKTEAQVLKNTFEKVTGEAIAAYLREERFSQMNNSWVPGRNRFQVDLRNKQLMFKDGRREYNIGNIKDIFEQVFAQQFSQHKMTPGNTSTLINLKRSFQVPQIKEEIFAHVMKIIGGMPTDVLLGRTQPTTNLR